MVVTYRNNRLVPAVIIALCLFLVFYLVDPTVENFGNELPKSMNEQGLHKTFPFPPNVPQEPSTAPLRNGGSSSSSSSDEDDDGSSIPPVSHPNVPKIDEFISDNEDDSYDYVKTSSPPASRPTAPAADVADDDGVVLIMKTGGTSLWKRLLIHLFTSFSPTRISPSNVAIYSDMADSIGGFTIIDALANSSTSAKAAADFDVYRQQPEYVANNWYVEGSGVGGDEWGPVGGWIIDKYKFVPLMQHAGRNWPDAKWYVYMEDDAYIFLPNVRKYLARFDWRKPHYLGSYAAKSDVIFAHGGAGFALSRGAWEKTFGDGEDLVEKYHDYTAAHCCGDQVLAHALKEHGVNFGENGGDGKFTWGFTPVVHWSFSFSRSNWCAPVLSFHKVHQRDVSEYEKLEKSWDWTIPLLFRDFFTHMILPNIQQSTEWWDNTASKYEISSANKQWPPVPEDESTYDAALWKRAWESVEACEAACKAWDQCMMWTFVEDLCKMDDAIVQGQGVAPGMSQRKTSLMHTSGWIIDRLDEWNCE